MPHTLSGETIWAYIEPQAGAALTVTEVLNHCRGKLPRSDPRRSALYRTTASHAPARSRNTSWQSWPCKSQTVEKRNQPLTFEQFQILMADVLHVEIAQG
jgi:hypothetical protein